MALFICCIYERFMDLILHSKKLWILTHFYGIFFCPYTVNTPYI